MKPNYDIEILPDIQGDRTYFTYTIGSVFYPHKEMFTTKSLALTAAKNKVKEMKKQAKKYPNRNT